jgi:hypothetical protein
MHATYHANDSTQDSIERFADPAFLRYSQSQRVLQEQTYRSALATSSIWPGMALTRMSSVRLRGNYAASDFLLHLGPCDLVSQRIHPCPRERNYLVAHSARPAVEFERSCRKETAASKNVAFHVIEPARQHRVQPLPTVRLYEY